MGQYGTGGHAIETKPRQTASVVRKILCQLYGISDQSLRAYFCREKKSLSSIDDVVGFIKSRQCRQDLDITTTNEDNKEAATQT